MSSDQYRGRGRGRGGPRGGQSDGQRYGEGRREGGDGGRQWQPRGSGGGYQGEGSSRGGHGDGGDFRGPRGDSPVRLDVRQTAESVKPTQLGKFPKGRVGPPVELISNLYPAKQNGKLSVRHYDIEIRLRKRDGTGLMAKREKKSVKNERKVENKQIIDRMAEEWTQVLRPNSYAFDGNKNLFTVKDLKIGSETRVVAITLDGFPEQTYEVEVKFVRVLPIDEFNANEKFIDVRQAMDIVLRQGPQDSMVGVGRNFFKTDAQNTKRLVNQNCSIGFGHHQSILKTEGGLAVNVDRVTTIFRTRDVDEPLIDYLKRELKVNSLTDVTLDDRRVKSLSSKLRDLKIYTNHILINKTPQKRKTGIEGMSNIKAYEHSFVNDEGITVSLEQYFRQKYRITLRFREVPLLKMKGGTKEKPKYLPVELCHVYPNQTMPKPLITPEIQRQIVESTNTQTPLKRFEKIQNSLESIKSESQALMGTFGLEISPHPIKLLGRQIPVPRTIGNANRLKDTLDLDRSIFLCLSPDVRNVRESFNSFFSGEGGLIRTAQQMGFKVALPRALYDPNDDIRTVESRIQTFIRLIRRISEIKGTQIVFICLPFESQLYEMVKHLSENVYGVITQCIKDSMFVNPKRGYFNNFLLKTNAKLNGQNQALASGQIEYRPKVLTDRTSTMIIGADVTHPGFHNPLANERVISSIAAVVGSYDSDFTKFMATVSAQGMNTEYIGNFGEMFKDLVNKINKGFPKNIIIFRDGVSESQLSLVLLSEIPQIEEVYRRHNLEIPKITAYVVQKRHHIRLFLNNPEIDRKNNKLFNMKSGTVVDHTITNLDLNEFHLCSHSGRLGTSRHAKYVVIRNDHKFSADKLQMLGYSMCFTYCRSQSPISIPIPVKYADLAAYRAKQHTAAQNSPSAPRTPGRGFEVAAPNEAEDQLRARERRNIQKLNESMKVAEDIVKIPYYC